ncbi:MFS transporter [Sphingomonas turrisvirgatae]|uniref:Major facilitator superfamily (MFS) profile domain-containing protein n=1 Tax=Sphingomonas turrisvirgatae TaxID=1888892 RepID=A0A1E3LVH1_9SPHN|nr:MFS transporter [Sphingomonas turrisvirgatae]ODP37746.1 hypothetical protein BFL28_01890 [Sphingomonas turrisvirgatae]
MRDAAPVGDSWPPRRQARWALLLLLLAYILSFIDRIILSILIRPVSADLALSDMQFALVGGVAFSLFYVTVGLPIGWLVDRVSRRVIVAIGIALWSLCTIASGLAPSFGWLFLARVGVGIGEAALSPAAYSLIADYFPPERRGRAVAIYTLGVSLGSSIAYLVGGALMSFAAETGGIELPVLGELSPWRFVFAAVGLPGLLLAAFTLTMREPPRRSLGTAPDAPVRLLDFLRANKQVSIAYILGYSFINLPFAGFLLWGPALFGRLHDMGPGQLALPLALIFLVPTTLGQWFGAAMTDRAQAAGRGDAAFRTGMWCALALVPVSIAMPLLGNAWAALAALAILVFLVCASVGHHAVVAAAVAPNRLRGVYVAIFFFVQNVLGQAVIALVTAFLTDRVFGAPSSIGLSMAIVGGVGAMAGFVTLALGRGALRRTVSALPS